MTELPGILAEIADVAGEAAARRLVLSHGGYRVQIPAIHRPGCWLDDVVGSEAAKKIIDHFRVFDADDRPTGLRITLPNCDAGTIGQARRNARIAFSKAIAEGHGVRTAARRAGITERAGWDMKARMSGSRDDDQGSLF